ncbi:barstar family protein [Enhygromyxa salina]|uniref:barstar family protein n=1 Tax=Enhygromyxa salina TaxID=215803 RepID=UPI0011BAD153|nr:barstar family protein [Enhygromyxa salina]
MIEPTEAWVHVIVGDVSWEHLAGTVQHRIAPNGLVALLDGRAISSISDFYSRIETSVPLIRGFGGNLDALVDLIRTFGWADHAGKQHVLVWYRPETMLIQAPDAFRKVLDVIVGVSKELLVGEELDPTFNPDDREDWISTRLELVFVMQDKASATRLVDILSRLSSDWADEFRTLDIPVSLEEATAWVRVTGA